MKKLALALLAFTALVPLPAFAAATVTELILISGAGTTLSRTPVVSSDGRFVAFSSADSFGVPSDSNNSEDIFVFDRDASSFERISLDKFGNTATGPGGVANSYNPSISADGRYVVFTSVASNLVSGDTNGNINRDDGEDIFIVDRQAAFGTANRIRRVSVRPGGAETNLASRLPSISGDGTYVAFQSGDTGLVAGTSGANNYIYIVNTSQIGTVGGIALVPVPSGPPGGANISINKDCLRPAISGDGNFVTFDFVFEYVDGNNAGNYFRYRDIYRYNRPAPALTPITGEATTFAQGFARNGRLCQHSSLSSTGQRIAFESNAPLTVGDTNGFLDIFVYDVPSTLTTLVSVTASGVQGNLESESASISGDGRFVAFETFANNLVIPDATGFNLDILRKDLTTGALSRCNTTPGGGTQGNGDSVSASLSFDGTRLAFASTASNLGGTQTLLNVYLATLQSSIADLQSLTTTAGALTPTFDKDVLSYTASVGSGTNSVTVTPIKAQGNATIEVRVNNGPLALVTSGFPSGNLALNVGANPIDIVVTAQDGTMKTYTVIVTRLSSPVTLAEALDTTGLTWSTGGNQNWFGQTITTHDGVDAGQSGDVNDFQESWAETTVTGPGTLTFWWKVSSESTFDHLRFLIDGVEQPGKISGTVDWVQKSVAITAGAHTLRWSYLKDLSDSFGADAGWVDEVTFTGSGPSSNADLQSLTTTAGALTPPFAGNVTSYTVSVPNATTSITITPTVQDPNATVKVNNVTVLSGNPSGPISLNVGANSIDTVVTAQDGTPKTYTIIVTRAGALSNNADLQNLTTTAGAISPGFASNVTLYTVSVPNATSSITITPTVQDPNATVKVNNVTVLSGNPSGSIFLNVGANPIDTVVTAQDGTPKTYRITITRAGTLSNNADLQNLTTTAGAISPAFAGNVTLYTASVPNATSSITITPTVLDAGATVKIQNTPVVSGVPSFLIPVFVGLNTIDIEVTAADTVTKKTYRLEVTKAGVGASNADLASLTTTADPLTPAFASGTINYTASVTDQTMMMTVTPTTVEPTATVKVNGVTVASGTASAPQMLMISPVNPINVEVTAPDGTTKKTYTILVARGRHGSNNADLASLTLTVNGTPVTFNKPFDPAVVTYTAGVPNGTTVANLTATVAESHATLKFNGTAATSGVAVPITPLAFEANPVRIAVKPEDANTHAKIYTLWILKLAPGQTTPTGNFVFGSKPTPGGGGQAIIDTNGNYVGFVSVKLKPVPGAPPECPAFQTDTATDEAGKIAAMALVDTFTRTPAARARAKAAAAGLAAAAAPLDNLVHITGAVKTVNGIPTVTAKSTTKNSTLEGSSFVGTGKVVIPASLTAVVGGSEIQGVMASGSVKVDGVTSKSKPAPVTWPIDPLNTSNIRGDWNFSLTISEKTDAKGKKFIVASSLLYLPGGDTTRFKEKKVTFSAKNGYSISFSGGAKLNEAGVQIVNPVTGKLAFDKKSKVMISKMLLTLNTATNLWEPTAGVLKCQFLGQKQTFPLVGQLLNK